MDVNVYSNVYDVNVYVLEMYTFMQIKYVNLIPLDTLSYYSRLFEGVSTK